ncbi:MAG: hypothetical protein II956_12175 [Bacteroidales bacterium]|nr:hypothetical protein [Bacteroidales bacterium]
MKKENLIVVSAMVMFAILFGTACQKDGDEPEFKKEVGENSIIFYSPDTSNVKKCISKSNIIYRYSSVMMENSFGDTRQYKTLRIRIRNGEPIQEWFCEDISAGYFGIFDYICQDGDEDGEKYGGYYRWEDLKRITQRDMDDLITNCKTGAPETGFHIPNEDELEALYFYLFRNDDRNGFIALKLNYDGFYDKSLAKFDHPDNAYIWINSNRNKYHPNPENFVGSMAMWPKRKNGELNFGYTNNTELYLNVRLMRTLKDSQW